jgi:hypothetical protein
MKKIVKKEEEWISSLELVLHDIQGVLHFGKWFLWVLSLRTLPIYTIFSLLGPQVIATLSVLYTH